MVNSMVQIMVQLMVQICIKKQLMSDREVNEALPYDSSVDNGYVPLKAKVGRSMFLAANFVKCPFVLCVVETWVVAVERRAVLVLIFNYLTFC